MKLYGLFGKGSGKLGSSVFAISSGEQIVREYNPVVENPNTPAQVEQRAKFKLLSQLAASLASIIVIPKNGLVSSRNRFIGYNMPAVSYTNGTASVELEKLTITGGARHIPGVTIATAGAIGFTVNLQGAPESSVSAVVYCVVKREGENGLRVLATQIVEKSNDNTNFQAQFEQDSDSITVFAYGIIGDVAGLLASYGDYNVANAQSIAQLVSESSTKTAQLVFTETKVVNYV